MDITLTEQEKRIVSLLQEGIPLRERPFAELAEKLGLTEEVLIEKINDFTQRGLIRRFGATLRQRSVGFTENAMVVWDVPDELADETGQVFAGFSQVTHCYRRPRRRGWPYNLFTMIHGHSKEYCQETAAKMAEAAGVGSYALLYSTEELKKSSMRYFT